MSELVTRVELVRAEYETAIAPGWTSNELRRRDSNPHLMPRVNSSADYQSRTPEKVKRVHVRVTFCTPVSERNEQEFDAFLCREFGRLPTPSAVAPSIIGVDHV